jgi:peptide subunit release factor 1 (eRF1)
VPARNEITEAKLEELARLQADGPRVLSLYLNLDPERFATPPARASEIDSLLDEASRQIESQRHPHEELMQLRGDLDRVRDHLQNDRYAEGAQAHAVFSCSKLDLFEALSLPEPVESGVTISDTPFIEPLAEIGPPAPWCVALVNRRVARILRGSANSLSEVVSFGDRVHGQHSQGGWSQARYQRSVEHDVDSHLRHTSEVLLRQFERSQFVGLLLAAPEELRTHVAATLHPYVRDRLVGFLKLDVENSTLEDVRAEAANAIEDHQRAILGERLEELRARLGRGERAAAGADDVLRALYERRVGTLLYDQQQQIKGGVCPQCGLMQTKAGACPVDGTELEPRDDLLEQAVRAALEQDAEVLTVETPDLGPLGGIAALLRF